MSDPRLTRPSWRGRTNVDALTIAALEHAERIGGHRFTVTQGSYQGGGGDPLSAGTHDGGGVVDLRWCGHVACIAALRKAGFAAWHRTPAQGPWPDHIHAVVVGHPLLAGSAARQVDALRSGLNGLASQGADDGPRLPVVAPAWPPVKAVSPLTRRSRWLAKRRKAGKKRPLPLRVVVVNGMSSSGVKAERTRAIIRAASEHADVLLMCEVFNLRVRAALSREWDVIQYGSVGHHEAGSAVAVRKARGTIATHSLKLGVTALLFGRLADRMRNRYWVHTSIVLDPRSPHSWSAQFSAGHAPPARNAAWWKPYVSKTPKGIAGADWNRRRAAVVARFPRRMVRMIGLLGTVSPRWIPTSKARPLDVGGDHLAAVITYWPKES